MAIETFKRYEKKFRINHQTYENIVEGIRSHMHLDTFNKDGHCYTVSNIYYDTWDNILIGRSIMKPVYKEKLRLRAYGVPTLDTSVFLEIKKKYKGIVNKRRTKIKLKEAYDFVDKGIYPNDNPRVRKQVLHELEYLLHMYDLKPMVYLSYDRWAYHDNTDPDFRVTFDTNITTRREDLRLESGSYGQKLLPEGTYIMEVKTLTAIPLWFIEILSKNAVYANSFSKYGTEYKMYCEKRD